MLARNKSNNNPPKPGGNRAAVLQNKLTLHAWREYLRMMKSGDSGQSNWYNMTFMHWRPLQLSPSASHVGLHRPMLEHTVAL